MDVAKSKGREKMAARTRLKKLRQERGFSRMDLVRQAEISYPTVVKWENEVLEEIDTTVLTKLCVLLNCTLDEFLVLLTDGDDC